MLRRKPSAEPIEIDGLVVTVRRSERARRIRLLVDAEGAKIVVPKWATRTDTIDAVARHRAWIKKHLLRIEREERQSTPASTVLVEGRLLSIVHDPLARPTVLISGENLHIGGDQPHARLEQWLRSMAENRINDRLFVRSLEMGLEPSRVSIRDQKTKWGACTSRKTVTFNWRLVMAPPEVLDYVVVHELAHLKELNHSPRFWAIVAKYCPKHTVWRKWLRDHGSSLRLSNKFEPSS